MAPLPALQFETTTLADGDGARLIEAMKAEMAEIYTGLVLDGSDMPSASAADLGPPHGTFLVGRMQGRAVCCGGVKRLDDRAAEIKRMYVVPEARGQGVARHLLGALEDAARALGYAAVRLDTGPEQPHAQSLYASAGYREIANFNENRVATYFGEKSLLID